MSYPPPLRNRPNLHLALTQFDGSPRRQGPGMPLASSSLCTPYHSPTGTPYGRTAYSPFRSASLKPPTPLLCGSPSSFTPRRGVYGRYGRYSWLRIKRAFASKPILILLMVAGLTIWWFNGGSKELDVVKLGASGFGKAIMNERKMHEYQFYPASNPKIHVGHFSPQRGLR